MTRRRLIGGWLSGAAAAGAGATFVATAGSSPAAAQQGQTDASLTTELLATELLSIAVYQHVLASGLLPARSRRLARRLLGHEHAHAAAWEPQLHRLGADRPAAPATVREVDQGLAGRHIDRRVDGLRSERDCLDLLLDVEGLAEGAYYTAISKLRAPQLLVLAAELLASEAQHEAMLGKLLRPKDLDRATPYSFVEGIRG